jgi:transcriptional regulator with XRE-family HTH domain
MQEKSTDYYKIISKNVKSIRENAKLSQEKFAESINCSREYISRLENNHEKISLALLLLISQIYNKKPEEFFKL